MDVGTPVVWAAFGAPGEGLARNHVGENTSEICYPLSQPARDLHPSLESSEEVHAGEELGIANQAARCMTFERVWVRTHVVCYLRALRAHISLVSTVRSTSNSEI